MPMHLTCSVTQEKFECSEEEIALITQLRGAHPLFDEDLPFPTVAPMEFLRQFGAWGNVINLYKSKSAFSGTPQLSRYHPDLPYKICTPQEFWSQEVDNINVGRPYDFTQSFFSQYDALMKSAYFVALTNPNCEGSDYVNGANGAKNSYLCFGIFNSESCLYSYMVHHSTDCVDCVDIVDCQYCYDCTTVRKGYACRSCTLCTSCTECYFCEDCIGCTHCLFSFGLRNAEYYVENKKVTPEHFHEIVAALSLSKRSNTAQAKQHFSKLLTESGHHTPTLINAEASSGYCLTNVQNVHHSYLSHTARDCGYIVLSHDCSDIWRGVGESATLAYQSSAYFGSYGAYNCYTDVGGSFNIYSAFLFNGCAHCFGCVGLNKKSYCILNAQYTKEEYFQLVPRIISHMQSTGEWGRFFPPPLAPVYYEDAFASDWMPPIPRKQAIARGYKLREEHDTSSPSYPSASTLPDSCFDLNESALTTTYACVKSGKPFRFQKQELAFYHRFEIPLPELHWLLRIRQKTWGKIQVLK